MVHNVELRLAGRGPFRGVARTVWSSGDQHAVRFIELSDADRLDIAEHMDELRRARPRAG